jgi:ribosomal protein L37AE/L43A
MWFIEQKVARPTPLRRHVDEQDDIGIRARDGYAFVMAITQGDRMECPKCHLTTHVPVMRMKEAKCEHCNASFRAVHYPLGDALLEHLRYSDPFRGGTERIERELLNADQARERAKARELRNEVEAATKDLARPLMGIPYVGYTGKEFRG